MRCGLGSQESYFVQAFKGRWLTNSPLHMQPPRISDSLSRHIFLSFKEEPMRKGNAMFKHRVSTRIKLFFILIALFLVSIAVGAQIDNCCFVDLLCMTDDEWVNGYWAYQSNQCSAPSQQPPSSSSQPAPAASQVIDNCCFIGWQCDTDAEWISGYFAFQHDQCAIRSHWEAQWKERQPAGTAASNSEQEQQQQHRHSNSDRQPQPEQPQGSSPTAPTNSNPEPDPTDPCAGRPRGYPDDPRLDCYFVARNCSWFCRTKKNP